MTETTSSSRIYKSITIEELNEISKLLDRKIINPIFQTSKILEDDNIYIPNMKMLDPYNLLYSINDQLYICSENTLNKIKNKLSIK